MNGIWLIDTDGCLTFESVWRFHCKLTDKQPFLFATNSGYVDMGHFCQLNFFCQWNSKMCCQWTSKFVSVSVQMFHTLNEVITTDGDRTFRTYWPSSANQKPNKRYVICSFGIVTDSWKSWTWDFQVQTKWRSAVSHGRWRFHARTAIRALKFQSEKSLGQCLPCKLDLKR